MFGIEKYYGQLRQHRPKLHGEYFEYFVSITTKFVTGAVDNCSNQNSILNYLKLHKYVHETRRQLN